MKKWILYLAVGFVISVPLPTPGHRNLDLSSGYASEGAVSKSSSTNEADASGPASYASGALFVDDSKRWNAEIQYNNGSHWRVPVYCIWKFFIPDCRYDPKNCSAPWRWNWSGNHC